MMTQADFLDGLVPMTLHHLEIAYFFQMEYLQPVMRGQARSSGRKINSAHSLSSFIQTRLHLSVQLWSIQSKSILSVSVLSSQVSDISALTSELCWTFLESTGSWQPFSCVSCQSYTHHSVQQVPGIFLWSQHLWQNVGSPPVHCSTEPQCVLFSKVKVTPFPIG